MKLPVNHCIERTYPFILAFGIGTTDVRWRHSDSRLDDDLGSLCKEVLCALAWRSRDRYLHDLIKLSDSSRSIAVGNLVAGRAWWRWWRRSRWRSRRSRVRRRIFGRRRRRSLIGRVAPMHPCLAAVVLVCNVRAWSGTRVSITIGLELV